MIVASSVVLPTPLRPRTASEPRSGRAKLTSSRIVVSPYPARTPVSFSTSGMRLAQVDVAHAPVGGDLVRRALEQHLALHQHGDALREAEYQVHVVLDDQHRDLGGELLQLLQHLARIVRGHAG